MGIFDVFRRKRAVVLPPSAGGDGGLDAEHLQLRRAIERCDNYCRAKEAGQDISLQELVDILKRNNFSKEVIKKAVEESWGEDVPDAMFK